MEKAIDFGQVQIGDVIRAETKHNDVIFSRQGKVVTFKDNSYYSENGVLLVTDKDEAKIILLDRPRPQLPSRLGSVVSFTEKDESYIATRISQTTWLVVITTKDMAETRQTAYSDSMVAKHNWTLLSVPSAVGAA